MNVAYPSSITFLITPQLSGQTGLLPPTSHILFSTYNSLFKLFLLMCLPLLLSPQKSLRLSKLYPSPKNALSWNVSFCPSSASVSAVPVASPPAVGAPPPGTGPSLQGRSSGKPLGKYLLNHILQMSRGKLSHSTSFSRLCICSCPKTLRVQSLRLAVCPCLDVVTFTACPDWKPCSYRGQVQHDHRFPSSSRGRLPSRLSVLLF